MYKIDLYLMIFFSVSLSICLKLICLFFFMSFVVVKVYVTMIILL